MRILYAIQGTGNGHITVAREVLPLLQKRGEVDILLSGTQVDIDLPHPIKYRLQGLSFIFGKKGGIDYVETYKKSNLKRLFKEIKNLPVADYDIVISDFEPVSAWACQLNHKQCIGFSHQIGVLNKHSPKPKQKDLVGKAVLKYYAPSSIQYGFHYLPYGKNVYTPIIRNEIRTLSPQDLGHYTVYLPAYSDKRIIKMLSHFNDIKWQVFSKHSKEEYLVDNISFSPIHNEAFIRSLVTSTGVLCNAGFQTPAEALFLQKKLMVIPMKGQYEQHCNAAALKMLGVPVIKNLKNKQHKHLKKWVNNDQRVNLDFPNETEWILSEMIDNYTNNEEARSLSEPALSSFSRFRSLLLKKIFYQGG